MNVWDMLQWILGGGMGPLAYWLMEHVDFLAAIEPPKRKRYVSFAVAIVVAWAALGLTFWFDPTLPATPQEWVNLFGTVAFEAVVASQAIHGERNLAAKKA
ncbi:MAG: hypothetical protein WC283_03030 [Candidatus Paceibacterota bacterium]|jgi:hypothetical protein